MGSFRLEMDMEARLRLADDGAKARFAAIVDALSGYENVKMIPRRTNYAFYKGKTVLARVTVKGDEVLFYSALSPDKLPKSYRVTDVSGVKRYASTPALLTVKTERRLETALKLVERLEKSFELEKTALIQPMDMEEFNMLQKTLIRRPGRRSCPL